MRFSLTAALAIIALAAVLPATASAQKKQKDVITAEEIEKSGQLDRELASVIRNLRPHMLEAPRGVRTIGGGMQYPVLVVVDGIRQTGPDALLNVLAKDVKEVRYLEPSRSQNEYGINANGGAIVIKTLSSRAKQ